LLRQIFEIPEGGNATADGTLRLATDPIGLRLLVSGSPERLAQVSKMLKTIDQPAFGQPAEAGKQASLQIEVYDTAPADPESVLKVMQTLLAESPGVRLATDPKTGYLIALARPSEQATIRATIDQMRQDAQSVEVIQLRVLDPQLAVLAITKLFGVDAQKAPSVDADLANRQLLIRGSAGQIAEVRTLLKKMGETFGNNSAISGGKLRLLSADGRNVEELIETIKKLWPALGSNELRFMPAREQGKRGPQPGMIDQRTPVPSPSRETTPRDVPDLQPTGTEGLDPVETQHKEESPVRLVAAQVDKTDGKVQDSPGQVSSESLADQAAPDQAAPDKSTEPPIFIFSGPDGLYASSENIEALDKLQELIDILQGGASSRSSEPKLTVFYLRNAQAEPVAERLNQLLAGATSSVVTPTAPGAAGGKGASPAPSGILGSIGIAGSIGRITPSGPVSITPDQRLNALLVQAAPADVDMIESILQILDRPGSPEDVPAEPKPHLIPVVHTAASEIAEVVKEVYKERLSSGNTQSASRAEQMMAMFRGRRGGRRAPQNESGANKSTDNTPKMSIGVDSRTNSLIVLAPDPLFEEVRELVHSLDRMAAEGSEIVEVVRLSDSNPKAVQETLSRLLGDSVQSGTTAGSGRPSSASNATRSSRGSSRGSTRGSNQRRGSSRN
jgi:type II secretory pathway component GspD/PulD (secretin)